MRLICREGLTESFLLTLREPITTGADCPDLIGSPLRPAVTGRVLLDATARTSSRRHGEEATM